MVELHLYIPDLKKKSDCLNPQTCTVNNVNFYYFLYIINLGFTKEESFEKHKRLGQAGGEHTCSYENCDRD